MWVRILKSCNQGINMYIKGELRDVSEDALDSLPADVYEPEASPWEAGVDQAARAREQAQQKFLQLHQENILAADKAATAVRIACDAKQAYHAAYSLHVSLIEKQGDCADNITRLAGKTNKKAIASFARQTAQLEELNKQVETARLTTMKLNGLYMAAEAEVDLQSRTAEEARLAADQAKQELSKYEQTKQDEPVSEVQSAPADDSAPADSGPEDADDAGGQAVSSGI